MLRLLLTFILLCTATSAVADTAWTRADALALLDYGRNIDTHGLNPADYQLDGLGAALGSGDPAAIENAATRSFALLARDLANGRVPAAQRRSPTLRGMDLKPEQVPDLIARALAGAGVAATLDGLAPREADYRRLRAALLTLPAGAQARRDAARATLERWRWLPRALGAHYLIVNIPEFVVREVADNAVVAEHRVIVGKLSTPTPQFAATITGVVFNPSWHVPQSIIQESVGALVRTRPAEAQRRGYRWTGSGSSLQVTQIPGPTNALGQMKLDMPNPLSIYLHDTPSKALFDRDVRAFSHGCIRTDLPMELAARLLAGTGWSDARIDATLASRETTSVPLPAPIPVYVVYLTARAQSDGHLVTFGDLYGLDARIAAALGPESGARSATASAAPVQSECSGLPG